MKAEIIAIGTELLLGHVVNTNAAFISQELATLGIDVYHHTTVGDNPQRLTEVIRQAEERSDILIFSGGLGPTKDDLTKKILADHLDLSIQYDEDTVDVIKTYYESNNQDMPKSNYNQAYIIEGSEILPNENGMAVGLYLEKDNHTYAMVPGIPAEMEVMVKRHLMRKLKDQMFDKYILESRTLRFFGTTESKLAEDIDPIIENQSNPTVAVYVDNQELTLRITAKAEDKDRAIDMIDQKEQEIQDIVGEYFFAYGEEHLPEVVIKEISKLSQSFSIAEDVTGGLITQTFTDYLSESDLFKGSLVFPNVQNGLRSLGKDGQNVSQEVAEIFDTDLAVAVTGQSKDTSVEKNLPTQFNVEVKFNDKVYSKDYDVGYRKNRSKILVMLYVMDYILDVIK